MGKSIGIDLGTTNSVAAIKKVETEVLENSEGELITPSCVSMKKGILSKEFIVGRNALEWRKQDPGNTITGIKRLMGRTINDPGIQNLIGGGKLHYKIKEYGKGSENSIAVVLGGTEFTPQEISAQILRKIKTDAEKALRDKVEFAVITVPAYFNDKQKHATRTAAALAGIKVRRLLPEPTAAAISFGMEGMKKDGAVNLLVFDFGGGTFDLSILTISGGQYIEQGKGGDMWLGGDDIDNALTDYVLKRAAAENNMSDILGLIEKQEMKRKNLFRGELKAAVEKAKITLSSENEAFIEILGVLKDNGGDTIDVEMNITREEFNSLVNGMVEKTVSLTKKLIESVNFTPDLIDKILLVGGSSKIPAFLNAMKKEFGENKVLLHERPMLAVAEGAAILSHRLSDTYECPGCGAEVVQQAAACAKCGANLDEYMTEHGVVDIVHAAAHDYYIHLENGEKHLFIEKNTPLPCEATETFRLLSLNQKLVHLKFSNLVNGKEEEIGELWLSMDYRVDKKISAQLIKELQEKDMGFQIEINMKIDVNNLIEVDAHIREIPEVKLSRTLSRGGSDEKLFTRIEKMIEEINSDYKDPMSIQEGQYRLSSAIRDVNNLIDGDTGKINEKLMSGAELKLSKIKDKLAKKDYSAGSVFYLEKILDDYPALLSPKLLEESQKILANVNDAIENADIKTETAVIEKLKLFLRERTAFLDCIMGLSEGMEMVETFDQPRASQLKKIKADLIAACRKGDMEKMAEIEEKNHPIIRATMGLTLDAMKSGQHSIEKGIRKSS
jgi:molecular chaperone DnaK